MWITCPSPAQSPPTIHFISVSLVWYKNGSGCAIHRRKLFELFNRSIRTWATLNCPPPSLTLLLLRVMLVCLLTGSQIRSYQAPRRRRHRWSRAVFCTPSSLPPPNAKRIIIKSAQPYLGCGGWSWLGGRKRRRRRGGAPSTEREERQYNINPPLIVQKLGIVVPSNS